MSSGEFPRSPRLLKGALAVYPEQTPGTTPRLVVFQYNPEQLRRTLVARVPARDAANRGAALEDTLRVQGPPVETINLSVLFNAADQLASARGGDTVLEHGLQPELATLELLLYPSTDQVQEGRSQAERGQVQVQPADLPLVLLVWGKSRVVPVKLTSFSVTEEHFDAELNPIHLKVDLALQVLTYLELRQSTIGYDAYLSYQRQKEQLAGKAQPRAGTDRVRGLLPR
jgi:hypothetical protein